MMIPFALFLLFGVGSPFGLNESNFRLYDNEPVVDLFPRPHSHHFANVGKMSVLMATIGSRQRGNEESVAIECPSNRIATKPCSKSSDCHNADGEECLDVVVGKYCCSQRTHPEPMLFKNHRKQFALTNAVVSRAYNADMAMHVLEDEDCEDPTGGKKPKPKPKCTNKMGMNCYRQGYKQKICDNPKNIRLAVRWCQLRCAKCWVTNNPDFVKKLNELNASQDKERYQKWYSQYQAWYNKYYGPKSRSNRRTRRSRRGRRRRSTGRTTVRRRVDCEDYKGEQCEGREFMCDSKPYGSMVTRHCLRSCGAC